MPDGTQDRRRGCDQRRLANALLIARDEPGAGLGGKKSKEPRKPRLDGTTLPEFDVIRGYFGTAGMTMQTVPEGWMFVGASLWKGAGNPAATAEPATEAASAEPATAEPAAEPAVAEEATPEPVGVGAE